MYAAPSFAFKPVNAIVSDNPLHDLARYQIRKTFSDQHFSRSVTLKGYRSRSRGHRAVVMQNKCP